MKKDWKVTLSYDVKHKDTYLIQNETKEDAIYIAENQNTSPRYDCTLIKEDESDVEDMDITVREVVFNVEKKDWINKEEEKQKAKAKKEDLMMTLAKSMHDSNRSGSNYGKLFLLKDIIIELDKLSLGVSSKAAIKTFLENKKAEVKKDIERDSKYPDPFLDKL